MEHYIEAAPLTRIVFTCSDSFRLWTAVRGQKTALVGPRTAATRTTSYIVPDGCSGLVVETDVKAMVNVTAMQNLDPREVPDTTRLVQEIDSEANWTFDKLANRIAAMMRSRNEDEDFESIEEASDFDMPDEEDPPWAHYDIDYMPVVEEDPSRNPEESPETTPEIVPETVNEAPDADIVDSDKAD